MNTLEAFKLISELILCRTPFKPEEDTMAIFAALNQIRHTLERVPILERDLDEQSLIIIGLRKQIAEERDQGL